MSIPDVLPDWLTMPGSAPELVKTEILEAITLAINGHERSQQTALGPSEIGQDCARRIGYQLLGFDENPREPAWKPTVGTGMHTWMETLLTNHNAQHYEPDGTRWILEQTLYCGQVGDQPLIGHCDCYDQVSFGVIDWKFVGPTQLKKYKAKGPGNQYRVQAHTYGRGWQLAGRRVDWVAVFFLPRDGELRDAHFWHEPYDERNALDGIARVTGIAATAKALGEQALAVLPTADQFCRLCPFHRVNSTDLSRGCPGDPSIAQRAAEPALTLK